jgi:superfamily I DNA/RNA helicase
VLADSSTRKAIREHLRELGCPSEEFEKADGSKRIDLFQPSVKLLTRGSAKGIEFAVLFLPRVTARAFPASDSDGEAADRARRDLYTAMMRCAWMLRLSSTTGERSPLLDELKSDCVEQVVGA